MSEPLTREQARCHRSIDVEWKYEPDILAYEIQVRVVAIDRFGHRSDPSEWKVIREPIEWRKGKP